MEHSLFSGIRTFAAISLVAVSTSITVASAQSSTVTVPYTLVSITDGKDRVNPGGDLMYVMTVQQNSAPQQTTDVTMTLPTGVNIVAPDNGGRVVGNMIVWDRLPLALGEQKILSAHISLLPNIPQDTRLVATVEANGAHASDATVVQSGLANSAYQVSVTDSLESALPGSSITYTIKVKNLSSFPTHEDVVVNASNLVSVTTTNPLAQTAYPRLTWQNVAFAPNEQKTFTFTAEVNRRLTPYAGIYTSAKVGSVLASDTTLARPTISQRQSSSSSSSVRSQSSSVPVASQHVLFRKASDAGDVIPGGTVYYTIFVQNVLLNVIRDAVVTDRFDPSLMSIIDANGGTVTGNGTIQWTLPTLQPGQIWKLTYSMRVSPSLPNGTVINNVATISGKDVAFATLNEKVNVVRTGVVGVLPATGASFDLFFLLGILPFAIAGTMFQKKSA